MTQGIILAAGYSSRAKTNKMLLTYNDKFLLSYAIEGMLPFVDHVFVVTGHYHDEVINIINQYAKVSAVFNPIYDQGMFTSVQAGVMMTNGDFFILPGDCPFVSAETYQKLLNGHKDVRVPVYENKQGHPLFIMSSLKEKLLEEPPTSNLKVFRNRFDYEIIKTDDPKILIDIDTQHDYQALNK
jgi:molybdenum cofactor cytidylyltransferase